MVISVVPNPRTALGRETLRSGRSWVGLAIAVLSLVLASACSTGLEASDPAMVDMSGGEGSDGNSDSDSGSNPQENGNSSGGDVSGDPSSAQSSVPDGNSGGDTPEGGGSGDTPGETTGPGSSETSDQENNSGESSGSLPSDETSSGDATEGGTSGDESSGEGDSFQDCDCAPNSELIYFVDHRNRMWRFDPRRQPLNFEQIGTIDCQDVGNATSGRRIEGIAVDHRSRVWVMTRSGGELLVVDTQNDNRCEDSMRTPGADQVRVAQISFSRDRRKKYCDNLYLHSASSSGDETMGALAKWTPKSQSGEFVGNTPFPAAKLAGSSDSRLFAAVGSPRELVQLDTQSGAKTGTLTAIPSQISSPFSFVKWGEDFYFFSPTLLGINAFETTVWKLSFVAGQPIWQRLSTRVPTYVESVATSVCASR